MAGNTTLCYLLWYRCLTLQTSPFHTLQRKLREISTKYQLFQKPANFEQRMLDCKRVLDGAKAELHILDVGEVDPEKIQSHLAGCMVRAASHTDGLFFLLIAQTVLFSH